MLLFLLLDGHMVVAYTILPRFALVQVMSPHGLNVVPQATHIPSAESSSCLSTAESLATDAPTLPPAILTYEASLLMTASGCQSITPPATLAAEWGSWTSSVNSWLRSHSSDYMSYLSHCEPWQLAASCPTGAVANSSAASTASSSATGITGASDSTTDSVTITTSTATAMETSTEPI
ncbi:hypothetical protein SEUCBS139899_005797 [Sporothrix eucalyptigena]